ncbi:MAG TPA: DNA polymerase III subunit chi [Acidiferrobacter sp.]|nr:DNA polymerase III subunit chi [Acidiferrobacter sp.]
MTRVDFYLGGAGTRRDLLACRLAETAYRHGHKVLLWVPEEQLPTFDALLWTFSDDSFVPHGRADADDEPVLIGTHEAASGDVLIPLVADLPSSPADFARILEAVGDSDAEKEQSRARFRYYRQQGLSPTVHTLP